MASSDDRRHGARDVTSRGREPADRTGDADGGRRGGRRPSGWAPLRPSADDPAAWAVPLGTIGATAWRVHALMGVWAVLFAVRVIVGPLVNERAPLGAGLIAIAFVALIVAVLVHEAGRVAVLSRHGVAPLTVALWPLGGFGEPPRSAPSRALVAGATSGLGILVAVALVTGVTLGLVTGDVFGVAIPRPLSSDVPDGLAIDARQPAWLVVLWLQHRAFVVLLMLHLLPMPLFDAGRLLHAMVQVRGDAARADGVLRLVGLVTGATVLLASILLGSWTGVLAGAAGLVAAAALKPGGAAARPWPLHAASLPDAGPDAGPAAGPGTIDAPAGAGEIALEDDDDALEFESFPAQDRPLVAPNADPWDDDPSDDPDATGDWHAAPGPSSGPERSSDPADDPGTPDPAGPTAAEADQGARLDAVLDRIAQVGLHGLTAEERGILAAETERRGGERPTKPSGDGSHPADDAGDATSGNAGRP